VVAVVVTLGVLLTGVVSMTAWILNRRNERNLLEVQTRQAAAVLTSAILSISDPLHETLQIAEATGGDPTAFRTATAPIVGPARLFVASALVDVSGPTPRVVATAGEPTELSPLSGEGFELVGLATRSTTFVVTSPRTRTVDRVAYAVADPDRRRYVVYAERAIPASRVVPAESNPAFADLNFATYLGPTEDLSSLATTDVPLDRLPLSGDTAEQSVPFGNSSVTLVTSARTHLGGELGWQLPWILLVGGIALSVATAIAAAQLVRSRRRAEDDRRTIATLYQRLDGLYSEQRSIAQTLQQALLPPYNPKIPHVEIATSYVAGAKGVDIGGDWYSVISVDERHFGFVIGDVSGRGVRAAAIMARMRFTMRAYLVEGHPPHEVLSMCSRQLDVVADDHFATALIGLADVQTREVTVANAGHLPPLMLAGTHADYISTQVGPPVGVGPTMYEATAFTMEPGSILLAFTDGLVERRSEIIDVGLERLVSESRRSEDEPLEAWVDGLVERMTNRASEDDVAVLAFRWTDSL
jgi:serine phosphatase RsbU (regulator of sigma subunit)